MYNINDVSNYFQKVLEEITYELYNGAEITIQYKYRVYPNSGDLINPSKDLTEDTLVVNVRSVGKQQDTSTPIEMIVDAYALEFLGRDSDRENLDVILKKISQDYKAKMDALADMSIQTLVEKVPEISSRDYQGDQYITAQLPVFIVSWTSAVLSNSVSIYIGDEANEDTLVKYSTFSTSRGVSPYPDMRKYAETPFAAESSTFSLNINGIFYNKDVLKSIRQDHMNNTNFGSQYNITIRDAETGEEFRKTMLLTNSDFTYSYGKVIAYTLSFTTYGDLTN